MSTVSFLSLSHQGRKDSPFSLSVAAMRSHCVNVASMGEGKISGTVFISKKAKIVVCVRVCV